MSNRRYTLNNPSLSEYVYRTLQRATIEQIRELSHEEQKIFKDDRSMNLFAQNNNLDKITYILTKLGVSWVMMFGPDEHSISQTVFTTFNQYEYDHKRVDAIDATTRSGVFATGSKELMLAAMMTTQNCSTQIYELSQYAQDIKKRGRDFNKIKTNNDEFKEAGRAYHDFNRLVTEQLNSFDWALQNLNLEQNEIRILSALFEKRTSAATITELSAGTRLGNKKSYLKKYVESLQEKKMLIIDNGTPGKMKKSGTYYMITSLGIKQMMKYINYLHELTFGR